MTLTLPMAFVLLDLHDDEGVPLSDPEVASVLLGAAMLAELELVGRLNVDDDRVTLRPAAPDPLLEPAVRALSSRPMTRAEAIAAIADPHLRHTVHSQLVGLGVLTVTRQNRWFRRPTFAWPTADPRAEHDLRTHLRAYLDSDVSNPRDDTLLVLIERAGLLGQIWDRPPLTAIRARTSSHPLREALREALAAHPLRDTLHSS